MIPRVPWIKAADFIFLSHIWLGGWSFLVVRSWMYHLLAFVWGLAVLGFAIRYFSKPPRCPVRPDLLLLAGFYLAFLLALGYHALITFADRGIAGTLGYYLCSVVVAEAILIFLGLSALLPKRLVRVALPLLTLSFAALEAFGIFFYMIPYYTGLIAHLENGNMPTLRFSQLAGGGAHTILERLAMNKPDFLNVPVLVTIGCLFLLATMTVVATSFTLALRRPER